MASVTGAEGSNYDRVPIINFDCMGNKVLILLNPNSVLEILFSKSDLLTKSSSLSNARCMKPITSIKLPVVFLGSRN